MSFSRSFVLTSLLLGSLTGTAHAFTGEQVPAFDHLWGTADLDVDLQKARQRAMSRLAHSSGIELSYEYQRDGSFALLRNGDVGEPLIRGFVPAVSSANAERATRQFIDKNLGLFGLEGRTSASLLIERNEVIGQTAFARGVHYVSYVQKVDGVRLHERRLTFALHSETGDLYAITSNVFGAPEAGSFAIKKNERAAVSAALGALGRTGKAGKVFNHKGLRRVNISGEHSGHATLTPIWAVTSPGHYAPAYRVDVFGEADLVQVVLSADKLQHLVTDSKTAGAPNRVEASGWDEHIMSEDGIPRAPMLRDLEADASASPGSWLWENGGSYRTMGPNVVAFDDAAGTFPGWEFEDAMIPFTAAATGGSSSVATFDYTSQWDSATGARDITELTTVEAWSYVNELHDKFYAMGFTEDEGNFQGDDPVLINVQDGYDAGTRNNATFSTPEDGTSGRMNMYVFTDDSGEERDGGIDKTIVAHELGHGLSHRLVNFGDNRLSGQQSAAFGEGHADVTAYMDRPFLDSEPDKFALATYVAWEYFTLVQRGPVLLLATGDFANDILTPMGRWTAYSYQLGDETSISDPNAERTFAEFGFAPVVGEDARGNRMTGFYGDYTYILYPEVHSDGEIWAAAWWRVKLRVGQYGWSGVDQEERLSGLEQTALMGMQMMPMNPNFIQARDAFIIYEEMTQDQSAGCMIKSEFARMGMGKGASAGVDGYYGAETDYDLDLGAYPDFIFDFDAWGCALGDYEDDDGEVTVSFSTALPEVLVGAEAQLTLRATTPGYDTLAVVQGPFLGTETIQAGTDYIDQSFTFVGENAIEATYVAEVGSAAGDTSTRGLALKFVEATPISIGDTVTDSVDEGENHHYALTVSPADLAMGDSLQFALFTLDDVDIDLYGNVGNIALPEDYFLFDADEDGNETLTITRESDGWYMSNEANTSLLIEGVSADESFTFYGGVQGFVASAYRVVVSQ